MDNCHRLINIMGIMVFIILILGIAKAEILQPTDCSKEVIPYQNELKTCNDTVANLTINLSYYQNLSSYYKDLYENKNITITNREIIILNQQINNLNMTVNDIKNELSFLKLTLKISIPIFSFTLISLWGFSIYLRKKLKEKDGE